MTTMVGLVSGAGYLERLDSDVGPARLGWMPMGSCGLAWNPDAKIEADALKVASDPATARRLALDHGFVH